MSSRLELKSNTLKRIGLGSKVSKADSRWDLNTTVWGQANVDWDSLWLLTYNQVPKPSQALSTRIEKPTLLSTRVNKPAKPVFTRV
jgi:hypothetical protein